MRERTGIVFGVGINLGEADVPSGFAEAGELGI